MGTRESALDEIDIAFCCQRYRSWIATRTAAIALDFVNADNKSVAFPDHRRIQTSQPSREIGVALESGINTS